MPDNKKPLSKEEIQKRKQRQKDADLKKQRNFSQGAGAGKRKVRTKTPSATYAPVEEKVNEIKPKGVVQPSPFAKMGQREIDSDSVFRKNATGPILKHCGGK